MPTVNCCSPTKLSSSRPASSTRIALTKAALAFVASQAEEHVELPGLVSALTLAVRDSSATMHAFLVTGTKIAASVHNEVARIWPFPVGVERA